jgi:type I restriction enzyme S subunit
MDIISGGTPKTSVPEYWSGNIPWLSVADFNNVNRYVYDTEKHISELGLKNSSTKILKKGQLIISARGTVGALAQLKRDMAFNQSCYGLNANSLTTNDFLFYLLKYCIAELKQQSSGGVFDTIIRETFDNISVFLPPLPEQKAIAEVLSSLDDKIDLLTRQNKTLEDLAQAYFRKWFIEDASDKWEEKGLDEIADFLNGLPLQKYPYKTGNPLHVIKIKELNNGFTDSSDLCSADIPEQYIVHPGDVIFSWSGSLKVDIWKYGKGALNQHLFKVTSCNYPKWFYYFWIKYHLPEFKMIAESKATTMGHIQRRDLSNAIVLVPENQEINNMDNIMSPLIKKIEQNNAQILVLQKLRDTLLPKLISGEIRVKM